MILSALDLSPVTGDATQAEAVRQTIEVARAAERLGYHRLWLAEHHKINGLGSPAPEGLIAALTQATSTIRLGAGGALRSVGSEAFPQYFHLLSTWLLDASGKAPIDDAHPLHDIHANPSGPSHPDLFVLCTSEESAAFAGQQGVGMVFAEFIARADG